MRRLSEGIPPASEIVCKISARVRFVRRLFSCDAQAVERRVIDLQASWRTRVGSLRADNSALAVIDRLPSTPLLTVRIVEQALGISFQAANVAIARLEAAVILTKTRAVRCNRAFEARELIDAFTDLERQMASFDSNTQVSPPTRNVPARPSRF